MHVHLRLGPFVPLLGLGIELARASFDLRLLLLVALGLAREFLRFIAGSQNGAEFGQVLLAALGLVEGPLVGGLGLLDRGVVLEDGRVGLRGAALIGKYRADRGQEGGGYCDAAGKRITGAMLRGVFD